MADITIYLVDDHAMLRDGLKHILATVPGLTVVGEAGDGKTALDDIQVLKPAIVVLDLSLPVMSGIDVARQLKKFQPETKIIILSQHGNLEYVNQLLGFGVESYLFKENASEYLVTAIREVARGNIYLGPDITRLLVEGVVTGTPGKPQKKESLFPALTGREREIVKLIAEGHSGKEIGKILRISEQTVKVHRSNIMHKLKINNIVDLIRYAAREGLIEL